MKVKITDTAAYVFVGFMLAAAAFFFLGFFEPGKEKAYFAAQDQSDACKTPAGYSDEQWRQHMSHHPDQYAQCTGV